MSLGNLLCSGDLNIPEEQVLLEWVQKQSGDPQTETEAAELLRHVRLELRDPGVLPGAQGSAALPVCRHAVLVQLGSDVMDDRGTAGALWRPATQAQTPGGKDHPCPPL